jgi:hypothetical protein
MLGPDAVTIRAQLARILASPGFQSHARASSFLAYVVGETIAGRSGEIKQATIGCEVFGRPASYDPKQDAIVRSVARVVREKLNDYYLAGGAHDPVRIEIPKGTYAPAIEWLSVPEPAPGRVKPRLTGRRYPAVAAGFLILLAGYGVAGHPTRHPAARRGDPSALYRAGRAKLLSGDFTGARPLLESAAKLAPRDSLIHAALADDLSALGYDALALEQARTAVAASGDLPPSGELQVEAQFRAVSGDHQGAIAALEDLLSREGPRPEYIRELAREQWAAAQWRDCLRTAARGSAADAQIAITEAYCRAGQGDYLGALQPIRRAVAAAHAAGQSESYARARLLEAGLLMSTGSVNAAAAAREEARRICSAIGDGACTLRALRIQANLDVFRGRPAPALAAYREALPLAQSIGSAKEIGELQDGEGWALMLMDDFAGAHAAFLESLLTGQRAGMRSVQLGQDLTALALLEGQLDRAASLADQAAEDARRIGDRVTESASRILKARALLLAGDSAGCAAILQQVRRTIDKYHLSADVPREWRLADAELNRTSGNLAAARQDLDSPSEFEDPTQDLDYQVARLELLLAQRRYDDGVRSARDTLAWLEGSGNRSATVRVTALLSDAYGYAGHIPEARAAASAAQALLSDHTPPLSRTAAINAVAHWVSPALEASARRSAAPVSQLQQLP